MKFRIVPVDVPEGELLKCQRGSRLVVATPPDPDQVHDVAPGEALLVRVVKPRRVSGAKPASDAENPATDSPVDFDVGTPDPDKAA